MAAKHTTLVTCPMHEGSCGEQVPATGFGDFSATQVKVAPCSSLIAQGWGSAPQWVGSKTQADRLLPVQMVQQHRDGLVTFAA